MVPAVILCGLDAVLAWLPVPEGAAAAALHTALEIAESTRITFSLRLLSIILYFPSSHKSFNLASSPSFIFSVAFQ